MSYHNFTNSNTSASPNQNSSQKKQTTYDDGYAQFAPLEKFYRMISWISFYIIDIKLETKHHACLDT